MTDADMSKWAKTDLSVLYDIFFEAGTRLGGTYVALQYAAEDAGDLEQAQFWKEEDMRMMRERQAVNSDDREAVIAQMITFNRQWQALQYARNRKIRT